jgi:predicted DNA-binding ribbon-helix-helix protein
MPTVSQAALMTLSDLVGAIDAQRQHGNLSPALRLYVASGDLS